MFPAKQSDIYIFTINSGIKIEIKPMPVNDRLEYFI